MSRAKSLLVQATHDLDPGLVATVHGAIERLTGERLLMDRAVGTPVKKTPAFVSKACG